MKALNSTRSEAPQMYETENNISKENRTQLNALMNQLLTRTLQNGLTNLNGNSLNGTQTPADAAAQAQAQAILTDLQGRVALAQQYGSIAQGSIRDIENVQTNLNTLQNCWLNASTNPALSAPQQATAASRAEAASTTIDTLDTRIGAYNDTITSTNAIIANIEELETQALTVGSVADVTALKTAYDTLIASGQLVSQSDLTTAQQNRTTLQSEMSSLNQSTQAGLEQCQAFH